MTKKHFELLADNLAYYRTFRVEDPDRRSGFDAAIAAVADTCEQFNPRF